MHYVTAKSILSSKNGMNIYRGCTHNCIYCDSRSNIYNMNHDFEDVEVKVNSIELLKKALKRKKEKSMIGIGSMSDPYMPLEKSLKYTRQALELVCKLGFGFTCITKSDLVLRDIDLFKKINEKSKAVLQMTLTAADDKLSKKIEPNVCTTKERASILKKFNEKGIPTVVWLCPVLPFITDSEENIERILDYCIGAEVYGIICLEMGLTLRDGNRQYFYRKLDEEFPGLKRKYIEAYGKRYALPSSNKSKLMKMFRERCLENNIESNPQKIFQYLSEFPKNQKHSSQNYFKNLFYKTNTNNKIGVTMEIDKNEFENIT